MADFSALQKYYERVNGFRFPEAELRHQWESTPDGRVGKQRERPGGPVLMSLMLGTKKYTNIKVPALVIFANPHSQGAWVDNTTDPRVQAAAEAYSRHWQFNRKATKGSGKWCADSARNYAAGRKSLCLSVK